MTPTLMIDKSKPHLGGNIQGIDINTFCTPVFDYIINMSNPRSIFDIGCGEGHLLKYFHSKNIKCYGSEGLEANYNAIPDDIRPNVELIDYTKTTASVIKVDVSISCEFVEHVKPYFIPNYLPHLCGGKIVIFTHAGIGQKGYHHVNCKDDKYWVGLMEYFGMLLMINDTIKIRRLGKGTFWINTLVFRNEKYT